MGRTWLVSGAAGTGKTTFALSGKGIVDYYEFDPGSFDRATIGLEEGKVNLHRFSPPLTNLVRPEKLSLVNPAVPIAVHRLEGWTEIWWDFVDVYLPALLGDGYPVIDTETRLWQCIRQAFLQEVQDASGTERERLNSLAYTEPNARYSQVVTAPKIKGRDLVLLAHEKEVWIKDKPTGEFAHDGYKEAPNLADCCLRFTIRDNRPLATITKAGTGGMGLTNREVQSPTLPYMNAILDAATAIRRVEGIDAVLPDTNSELLLKGEHPAAMKIAAMRLAVPENYTEMVELAEAL